MEITVFGADEVWLPIGGYEGIYEVSSHGRVRSLDRVDSNGRRQQGHLLRIDYGGRYPRMALSRASKQAHRLVHQVVLETFVGPRPDGLFALHRDDDGHNNCVWNLYWGTQSENLRDMYRNGKRQPTRKTHCPEGHVYSGENLWIAPDGYQACRTCMRASTRRWKARQREARMLL